MIYILFLIATNPPKGFMRSIGDNDNWVINKLFITSYTYGIQHDYT